MNTFYEDGLAVHQRVKAYQAEHPGTSYRVAYDALIREDKEREREGREEFQRRTKAYSQEFGLNEEEARQMLAKHDMESMMQFLTETPRAIGDTV